ncbi:MAG TPA: ABC transporter ATP-binding protein [Candidatus Eremiobacteraceae bacterium]|nr:ABC transporter ATP-binding protein [Candidatus Eremiobacteraceae bacterium]
MGLRKQFGSKVAVRGLSLQVRRGEIFGFLGPNGAGKSTSVKMLLGLVRPTSGQAWILGHPFSNVEIRRKVGFLPEDFRFYDWLTASELLSLHGRLCGLSPAQLRQRVPAYLELVGLTPHRDRRLRGFSKGMMQRIGLAQALIHEPELVFLDEPTSGLDPMGRHLVRDIIRNERKRGATVFLNSHLLSEVEITCDTVVFIKQGEVVGSRDLHTAPDGEIHVRVRAHNLRHELLSGLARWTTSAQIQDDRLTFSTHSMDLLPEILRYLVCSNVDVFEFTPERLSLEESFLKIMGEDHGL